MHQFPIESSKSFFSRLRRKGQRAAVGASLWIGVGTLALFLAAPLPAQSQGATDRVNLYAMQCHDNPGDHTTAYASASFTLHFKNGVDKTIVNECLSTRPNAAGEFTAIRLWPVIDASYGDVETITSHVQIRRGGTIVSPAPHNICVETSRGNYATGWCIVDYELGTRVNWQIVIGRVPSH